jgi:TnpA family transposase
MKILSTPEKESFENPPIFNSAERKRFFSFPSEIEQIADTLRTPTNKVCFLVMWGYFKATRKFFSRNFHQKDIQFVAGRLGLPTNQIKLADYDKVSYLRHKKIILDCFGFKEFDKEAERAVSKEINAMVRSQLRPRLMMLKVLEILKRNKVELPSYNLLTNLIVTEINRHKRELTKIIESHLTPENRQLLDSLLEKKEDGCSQEPSSKGQRYRLTLLKKFQHSTRPSKIKANIQDLKTLRDLFQNLGTTIQSLDLTPEGIEYYANLVIKWEIFQVSRKSDKDRNLHLLAFILYQYCKLQDALIDAFLISVQSNFNSAGREHRDSYYEGRKERSQSLRKITGCLDKNIHVLSQIKTIINAPDLSDSEKIERIKSVLLTEEPNKRDLEELLSTLNKESESAVKDEDFYEVLEAKSVKLQNRVSDIVKHIEFKEETSGGAVLQAIKYYKAKDGMLDKNAPMDFLSAEEYELVFDKAGKFRISLYKSLLFKKISDAIRAGTLNLEHSYKYRPLDEYLIPKDLWQQNREDYIKRAGLEEFADFTKFLPKLEKELDDRYHQTNRNILQGKNEFIKFQTDGTFQLSTPKAEDDDEATGLSDYFPSKHYISLLEILFTINRASGFLDAFEHLQTKYNRPKPPDRTFLAGIIGYGCNIGPKKIVKISKQIHESELENTINWYFSEDNIISANDKIVAFMSQLDLPNIYRRNKELLHTSSDGQKMDVAVDSLNAGYSFKYHAMDKGASAYRHIDERHFFPYPTIVFSSAEKEAPYVIDGLMHNDVVKSDIHSTDTDGFTEAIFATTYLISIMFAPRIKGLKKQTLYAFKKRNLYEELGYKIVPDKYINVQLIDDNWDDILRFIATIKLKVTTASQLFKRLNSYSKQHVLYQAVKELGKIRKTIFILKYIDDVEFRQAIEKQLNKIENTHKFSDAVSFGNNQEFIQGTKEEQEIAEGCRRLIENAIVCWNYLYLSQKLADEKDETQRAELLEAIKRSSIVTWQHINLHGEYDFSEEKLHDSIGVKVPKILELKLP